MEVAASWLISIQEENQWEAAKVLKTRQKFTFQQNSDIQLALECVIYIKSSGNDLMLPGFLRIYGKTWKLLFVSKLTALDLYPK